MTGRIKAGEGTIVGNAGEFYVVAELLKRGVIAALAPRNSPAFDILATKGGRTTRIRVKTKSEQYDDWQWVAKKDGSLFRDLSEHDDFTVLVNLTRETRDLAFYIVSTFTLNKWLTDDFERWKATPGKNGRPHNPENRKRNLPYSKYADRLKTDWDRIWREDGQQRN